MKDTDFELCVQKEFRFLIDKCGFTLTRAGPQLVRYTSESVTIEVRHSDRGELDVIVDENPPSHRFQMRLFLHAFHPAVEQQLGYGIANSADAVHKQKGTLSECLQKYGEPLVAHDQATFATMKTYKWWERGKKQ
jgi:hypothetical protein